MFPRARVRLGVWVLLSLVPGLAARAQDGRAARPVTVPMRISNNRVFIPVRVTGPGGRSVTALFWVDTGGDTIILSGHLARTLRLAPNGGTFDGMGEGKQQVVAAPQLSIGRVQLNLSDTKTAAQLQPLLRTVSAGIDADGFLPARVLKKYNAVFDYPNHRFILGQPGAIPHRGTPVPMAVQPSSGFARVELTIDGVECGFMLDTGAAYSGMSQAVVSQLSAAHPAWPLQVGAVGAANMVGKQFDVQNQMLLVQQVALGPFVLKNPGFVSRPAGVYENYISQDMSAPIVGVLAGNVLRQFRVDMDYTNQTVYLERRGGDTPAPLSCVGLVVRMRDSGVVEISGALIRNGRPEVTGVQPDDRLLTVDGIRVTGASLARVLHLLSGQPGQTRTLTVFRQGRLIHIQAPVLQHLVPPPGAQP